ncbi:23S rRNA (pseudouridine(1915)-N(3))-methyltransferase RlmH [Brevibacillus laterosporus]|uniref:23S rRNA (pseudouridine(1915)-N(3))-methyltransferase RlmH n=1 Tax=Brevibacillus laterosporus TaxID=1465 RepID=UPI0003711587|nr:23S rRNA (pseudouridine(1915)-N(3))-methyltransferase RlmH [Brevibacillus laterosporus]ATO49358.1 23S rRNA (pseudouridine(1915)-N(3))-methyltransferase RlmH [Brevibacillus laterosporus DSM 25]AYB40545.1 23S rRNA (pseudouridine(1915)-N(3))-methyltransferase RlmH [Brevibacillus laterosporus]MBG9775868.1 50S rRNA methyltransferase [Brevibacillus laterosporus]MBG9796709.1 50S rRNA methyltransferase [Brevibacillus laterosporus]MBG9800762.1 50S rRNA methyltransferase [Brevibacillus laterosporus]
MQITIITVGKLKEKYLKEGIAEYTKRLTAYCKLNVVEVNDEKAPEELSATEMEQVKRKEGERILAHMKQDHYVIALAIEGQMWSSEKLSSEMDRLALHGRSQVAFVIGGSLGLADEVLKRADAKLSFSKMTFPHQLMRLVLVEQVYRAFRISRGEPYHK